MSFSSLTFIIFFIAITLGYYILPKRYQWIWLLIGSYVFYMWSVPSFALFLFLSSFTTWIFPLFIGRINGQQEKYLTSTIGSAMSHDDKKKYQKTQTRKKQWLLFGCLGINIGILFFLKYTNMFINIIDRFGGSISPLEWLVLPLGISFYTFQSLGYAIDVYREMAEPQTNFWRHALYVAYFPQICQGPIGRYSELGPQLLKEHGFNYDAFISGLERLLWGLFKKLVIANRIAILVNGVYGDISGYSGLVLLYATFLYSFQLYADFSGYIDIGLGVSEILGIKLDENFDSPYLSHSIAEFWRRWHITLGVWFRDYLYYPILRSGWCMRLGRRLSHAGHRRLAKNLTTVIGLGLTWLLIGMWHGASFHYVAYGLYHGFFIIMAVIFAHSYAYVLKALNIDDKCWWWRLFQIARTFIIVSLGYILFLSDTMSMVIVIVEKVVAFNYLNASGWANLRSVIHAFLSTFQIKILYVSLIVLIIYDIISHKVMVRDWLNQHSVIVRWLAIYVVVAAIIFLGCYGTSDASSFIYFQF